MNREGKMSPAERLPWFQSHKKVQASQIEWIGANIGTGQQFGTKAGVVVVEYNDNQPVIRAEVDWYLVIYEDGYVSASPAKAFEEGYTALPE